MDPSNGVTLKLETPASKFTQVANRELASLHLISNLIQADMGMADVMEALVMNARQIFQCQLVVLVLLKNDQTEVMYSMEGNSAPTQVFGVGANIGNCELFASCVQEKRALLNNQFSPNEIFNALGIREAQPANVLCAPLTMKDNVLGVLALINNVSGQFDEADLELANMLTSLVAHKVHSDDVIQELQVANANLEVNRWQVLNSRNILRALFDSIPASIYIIDRKYNLAAVNMYRANRIGVPPSQLVGRRCYEALYGLDDPCPDCRAIETLFGRMVTNRTKREWLTDHDPIEWEISSYPIYDDEEAEIVQTILLEQDVTEKRRLEATLAQSEKLAAVGQLAAGLAHEINNPLTAIIANAQLLIRELSEDDEKYEMVDLISRAGDRANQVVRNLLDLARKEQFDFAPTDINLTIQNALTFLHHEFVVRDINLEFNRQANLPEVMASQDHLQGVWLNLITNAMDAIDEAPRKIRITTLQDGDEIKVSIADNGKGIPARTLSRIFEPFYTTKSSGHGTGLGLSVCHRAIKQHGGRILVDSQVNVGTQFTVILPIS